MPIVACGQCGTEQEAADDTAAFQCHSCRTPYRYVRCQICHVPVCILALHSTLSAASGRALCLTCLRVSPVDPGALTAAAAAGAPRDPQPLAARRLWEGRHNTPGYTGVIIEPNPEVQWLGRIWARASPPEVLAAVRRAAGEAGWHTGADADGSFYFYGHRTPEWGSAQLWVGAAAAGPVSAIELLGQYHTFGPAQPAKRVLQQLLEQLEDRLRDLLGTESTYIPMRRSASSEPQATINENQPHRVSIAGKGRLWHRRRGRR